MHGQRLACDVALKWWLYRQTNCRSPVWTQCVLHSAQENTHFSCVSQKSVLQAGTGREPLGRERKTREGDISNHVQLSGEKNLFKILFSVWGFPRESRAGSNPTRDRIRCCQLTMLSGQLGNSFPLQPWQGLHDPAWLSLWMKQETAPSKQHSVGEKCSENSIILCPHSSTYQGFKHFLI